MNEGKITHLPKYRTLGISYIMLDNRDGKFDVLVNDTTFKKYLCDINFGIGSSGIVEIKRHKEYSFEMNFHCSKSGKKGAACGTGSRCAVAYARDLGIVEDGVDFYFKSYEGQRKGYIKGDFVSTSMSDNCKIVKEYDDNNYFVDPKCFSHVRIVESGFEEFDIVEEGFKVTSIEEYQAIFPPPSFMLVKIRENGIKVRCYDREVHEKLEGFGCGTGETAAAMVYAKKLGLIGKHSVKVQWRDGMTKVDLSRDENDVFSNVVISGNAVHVFDISINLDMFKKSYSNK